MKQKMNRDQPPRMAGKQKRLNADRAEKFSAVRGDNLSSSRLRLCEKSRGDSH